MINLEINHKKITVAEGTSIIDAADQNNIYIPRFCYHKKLSVVANCRMCLVEIEGARKPLPACATLVTEGMKVYTQSKAALDAQRAVMEFLLINHPLDCPICDQGGQCELQDLAMGFGHADSDFTMRKHTVASLNLGPLIATDMTRCIRCTRCIRVGTEICGEDQMGETERGVDTEIGPYIAQTITSPLSGNMIDVCPVGALTSKPDAAHTRPWELYEHPTLATHDCWGAHTYTHTKGYEYSHRTKVMRLVPRSCEHINESWMTDRDRFSYLSYEHASRAVEPMIKRNGQWVKPGLEATLLETIDRIRAVLNQKDAQRFGAICSPNASVEEGYLLQKFMRAIGSDNIDHRIRMTDQENVTQFASIKPTEKAAEKIENSDYILIVGSHLPHDVPLANLRVLKATQNDVPVGAINLADYSFNYHLTDKVICSSNAFNQTIINVIDDQNHNIHKALNNAENATIILGHDWQQHPNALSIYQLLKDKADKINANLVVLPEGANSFGLNAAKVLPLEEGLSVTDMLNEKNLDACILLNLEAELDCLTQQNVIKQLKAMPLVICITPFVSKAMLDYADVILPSAMPFEIAGTWVNAQGEWQSIKPVTEPLGDAKPAFKIIQAMAKLMHMDGFDHEHSSDILKDCQLNMKPYEEYDYAVAQQLDDNQVSLIASWPLNRIDSACRRSYALQELEATRWDVDFPPLRMNEKTAQQFSLSNDMHCKINGNEQTFICKIDQAIADNNVMVECGILPTTLPIDLTNITLSKEV